MHAYIYHCKEKLLFQQIIWLLQLRDYPPCANSKNVVPGAYECREGESNCHTFVVLSSVEFSASKTRHIR